MDGASAGSITKGLSGTEQRQIGQVFSLHLLFHFGDLLLVGNRIVEELNRETTRIWIIPQNL